jgi:NAD(P)H-flavin reductase
MTYINKNCADAGTPNCPCPLAETGDCLICSRLAGHDTCDCDWAGVCVYNEFIQNDKVVQGTRKDLKAPIVNKRWYSSDLIVLTLDTDRRLALDALRPGSFVFLNRPGAAQYANVPVSIMKSDPAKGHLFLALKIVGSKTRMISEAEDFLTIRGPYRNGLLGGGLQGMFDDMQSSGGRWLIFTKGVGFAPAVNLLRWADGRVDADMVIDTDKVNQEIVNDNLGECLKWENLKVWFGSLESVRDDGECGVKTKEFARNEIESLGRTPVEVYDRVIILASDYYIKTLVRRLDIPEEKLVFSNNFHMCCGEGICGACGHVDSEGRFSKMCKCRSVDVTF